MPQCHPLRDFIRERLTAAAEEIFTEVEKTLIRYEESISVLGDYWKPPRNSYRIEQLEQHVSSNKEEVLTDPKLWHQQRSSSPDQEEPEPLQVKQEPEPADIRENQQEPDGLQVKDDQEEPEFGETVVRYQEESRLLDVCWNPELTRTGLQKPHVSIEEESSVIHQPWNQGRRSSDQEEPKPAWIKEEQREPEPDQKDLYSWGGAQFVQQRFSASMETSAPQEGDLSEEIESEQVSSHNSPVRRNDASRSHPVTKKRSFRCDVCGKCFNVRSSLTRHQSLHTGERPFPCDSCGNSFSRLSDLTEHKLVHTDERRYSCETCGKCFKNRWHLNDHRIIHTGERRFSCQICGKTFIRRNPLTVHMRTHTGERPFSCQLCGERFIERKKLNHHVKRKHESEKESLQIGSSH